MSKHVHRHRLDATIRFEESYDPADPASYTKALENVAAKRKALQDLGAEITHDKGAPGKVKAAAS